ncbi:hypothetical protein GQ600_17294 [Phytophthora cactorum]|nr:hypothetical protein GQ600_17294 [Phytophthora cactorum]
MGVDDDGGSSREDVGGVSREMSPRSAGSHLSHLPQEAGPGRIIVATYTSRLRHGDPSPAHLLPMSHQVVQGPRPTALPSSSFPPWVQLYLDMPFTSPGAKRCFQRILSTVLPDPTPEDVIIRLTTESLKAFFDFKDPNHPWQIMRQVLPEKPCLFDIAGVNHKVHVSKRAPSRVRTMGALLAAAVEKGFTKEAADCNHDQALLKAKFALWRLFLSQRNNRADRLRNMYQDQYMKCCLESVTAPRCSFIRPELIIEPSVPSYPVENLPFVPKTTDWLAKATVRSLTPIFCSLTADPITTGRAIIPDLSLTPPELVSDWHRHFFSGRGSPRPPAATASAGSGDEDSSASGAPLTAHTSSLDEE